MESMVKMGVRRLEAEVKGKEVENNGKPSANPVL